MASWGGGQPHQGVRHQEDDAGSNRGRRCPRPDGAMRRVGGAGGMRPRANVRVLITGEGLDLDAITEALGVEPTYTRLGETYDDWEYTILRAECASVSERLGTLRRALGDGAARPRPGGARRRRRRGALRARGDRRRAGLDPHKGRPGVPGRAGRRVRDRPLPLLPRRDGRPAAGRQGGLTWSRRSRRRSASPAGGWTSRR